MSQIESLRRLATIETRLDFLVRQAEADTGDREVLRQIVETLSVQGRLIADIHAVLHPEEDAAQTGPGVRELLLQILAAVESLRAPITKALGQTESAPS